MRKTLLGGLVCLITGMLSITQAQQYSLDTQALDRYLDQYIPQFKIPGFALAMIKENKVVYQKYYGTIKHQGKQPINAQAIFQLASCTKAFTAAGLGLLVQEGKIKWDDLVIKYLPDFKLADEWITKNLTIRDILSHRSGLAAYDGDLLFFRRKYNTQDVIQKIRNYPIRKQFRAYYGYQNTMYMVAGEIIHKVSGKPWETFIKERIFQPLQMNNSFPHSLAGTHPTLVQPYVLQKPIPFVKEQPNAAGSIFSSMQDMVSWAKMWLNNGKPLLNSRTVQQLFKVHTPISISNLHQKLGIHFRAYGLGWNMYDYAGKKIIEHGGFLPGYLSKIMLVPEEKLGIVMLSNDLHTFRESLFPYILNNYLKYPGTDVTSAMLQYQQYLSKGGENFMNAQRKHRKLNTSPSMPLHNYQGIYIDQNYGKAKITFKNNQLSLTLIPHATMFKSPLKHWQNDRFALNFYLGNMAVAGFAEFEVDDHDKIKGFKLNIPNPDLNFNNLHFKKM